MIASIQARMSSSRLPGKVMRQFAGKPLLLWQIERLARCATIDEIVVATTTNEADDQIEQLCTNNQVACFRGSENDVLGRICAMLESFGAQVHAEFYGDSPLLDSDLVDHSVNVFLNNKGIDLLTNTLERTYPSGLEINVYSAYRLIELDREMPPDATMREHVCANLKLRSSRYNILNFTAPVEHCWPDLYLELDEYADIKIIEWALQQNAESENGYLPLGVLLERLKKRPDLVKSNSGVTRRWKSISGQEDP